MAKSTRIKKELEVRFPEASDSFAEFAASLGGAEFGLKKMKNRALSVFHLADV